MKKVNLWISQQYILWPNMRSFKGYITYMISGGRFIHSWTYLCRNESPSLVAIFVIALFCLLLKEIPEHIWIENIIFVAYDNMCNLANMRSFPNLWKDYLLKLLALYISTTTNAPDVDFNPNVLKKELPNANTMIWEQTFTWLHAFISWKFT